MGMDSAQGEPGRAPLHPDELAGDDDDDDLDVGEEDLDFVSEHRAFLGASFLAKNDFRHTSRCAAPRRAALHVRH